ncbi:MAG TPA: aminoacyl--tRNA ligase-related protein, partial [Candidatus Babeliales bacterium]|nr:aminoacyl--tRNA ligase-related protein [Candidatus Babeliales bacterium]
MIKQVKGTEEILDLALQTFITRTIEKYLACHNFTKIQLPILQPTSLFLRTLGEESDVISKEMYIFKRGDSKESICLRPEATAPTMRAFLESGITILPWKTFTIGSMFRHERPQKGRWREFTQVNLEIIGSEHIAQDAHLIAILSTLFSQHCMLEDFILHINYLGTKNERLLYTEL